MIVKLAFSRYNLRIAREYRNARPTTIINKNYNKIFCIGFNKTGTTSLGKLLQQFGFSLGNQGVAEVLSEDWALHRRVDRIIKYCHTADAFQDMPFTAPGLYKELDHAFPNSKFILSVRDNPDQWLNSLKSFHRKEYSRDKSRVPNEADLENALYRYKGFLLDGFNFFWDYPQTTLYDEAVYKKKYQAHIADVKEYFGHRSENLIQVNVGLKEDFKRLCNFLNLETDIKEFPWENKT